VKVPNNAFASGSCEHVQCLKNIATGDESWVYGYDPETNHQSSQWKGVTSPRSKKGRQVRSKTKVVLLAFFIHFYSEVIVHHEYAPEGQTINKEFYVEVLRRLGEISSPKTTGQMAGWRLDPAARQCTRTHFTSCAEVFGQTRYRSFAAVAILTESRTV